LDWVFEFPADKACEPILWTRFRPGVVYWYG